MNYATCRGCGDTFKKFGRGQQSVAHPKLCSDCAIRELSYHGFHAPGMRCDDEHLAMPRGGRSHMKLEEARS